MSEKDIAKYPNFHKYVSTGLPLVSDSETKITAILDFATLTKGNNPLDENAIKAALSWGNAPMIKVANILSYGKYVPRRNPNVINIRKKWVKEFEEGGGKRYTKWGEKVDLVEVILLHELTHWADLQDGKMNGDKEIEMGNEFEKAIYGHLITHRSTIPA
ncbi:MAG: hypothetical protein R2747_15350 [Pyrinomonadaceae bacterium]